MYLLHPPTQLPVLYLLIKKKKDKHSVTIFILLQATLEFKLVISTLR